MNRLDTQTRVRIVSALVEGNSIRSTCRMTGVAKGTVLAFLADMGDVCMDLHDRAVRGLHTERLQCDEIWSFVNTKDKNLPPSKKNDDSVGSIWTWTAIDADSKMMVSWHVGDRTSASARAIMHDAAGRIVSDRVQLTSDGYRWYAQAVREAFADSADYSELQKVFGGSDNSSNARYSPAVCIGCIRKHVQGNPDPEHINTSYVERANLTMRMSMRRFTRLTNGFSKKFENHCAAIALHFAAYNFCKKHGTIGTSPAVKAGIADHVWTLAELVGLLDAKERQTIGTESRKRGPYKKRTAKASN